MKKLSLILLCLTSICYSAEIIGKVNKIYDGDTIQIIDDDGGGKFKIRFAEIDAPESTQQFGQQSKYFLADLIKDKKVKVKFNNIDMYGRIVGTVYTYKMPFIFDINVNEEMIKNGMVWFYSAYSKNQKLKEYESEARKKKLGLWKFDNNIEPWIYRKLNKKK